VTGIVEVLLPEDVGGVGASGLPDEDPAVVGDSEQLVVTVVVQVGQAVVPDVLGGYLPADDEAAGGRGGVGVEAGQIGPRRVVLHV